MKVGGDGMTSDANYERKVPYETFDDTNIVASRGPGRLKFPL